MKVKKNYTRETFKTREDWLDKRGFGGSSASAIFGLNPYQNDLDIYWSFVSPTKHTESITTESQQYGIDCEPLIRKQFAIDFPQYIVHTPKNNEMYRRKDKPYMTATVDGLLYNTDKSDKKILEIKTHDMKSGDEETWANGIPINYLVQVLHYMLVLNDTSGAILVAKLRYFDYSTKPAKIDHQEIRYYEIFREDKAIQDLLEKIEQGETKFYEEHIKKGVPPTLKVKA